jgi:hypothetical protein
MLLGNADFANVNQFVAPIQGSGLRRYLYIPPKIPMSLDDWPLMSELIMTQKRLILFMDYNANQTAVPYILDKFSQMWETPFSPTNNSFPCSPQRPPGLTTQQAQDRLFIANHNLSSHIAMVNWMLLCQMWPTWTSRID